jgi:ATP-dependent Clp protease adapter protein ClpS
MMFLHKLSTTTLLALCLWFSLGSAFTLQPASPGHKTISFSKPSSSGRVSNTFQFFAGPAVLDKPAVEDKVEQKDDVKQDARHGKENWKVRLYNDPMNKREFVARCLMEIVGLSDTSAYQTMMHAHNNGLAVIGHYNLERAELYRDRLVENGLVVDMVPADDE